MRRVLKGVMIGAVVAGCLASVDGAVLGLIASEGRHVLLTAAQWAVGCAAAGAAFGALVGGLCGLIAGRLVLPPPQESERCANP
jgi:hypothetical protein